MEHAATTRQNAIYADAARFLAPLFSSHRDLNYKSRSGLRRPRVTLTYAQSLDGRIAGRGGRQIILSGKESMAMTHRLRTMHAGIMVGIGTVLNDDPRLSARLLPVDEAPWNQPRPIIIDPKLRCPVTARLLVQSQGKKEVRRDGSGTNDGTEIGVKAPWIFCAGGADSDRRKNLEEAGAEVIPLEVSSDGRLPFAEIFETLHHRCIDTLMVEGGATVIRSLLDPRNIDLVDTVIVTIAPVFVGGDGVSAIEGTAKTDGDGDAGADGGGSRGPAKEAIPDVSIRLKNPRHQIFGADVVIAGTVS